MKAKLVNKRLQKLERSLHPTNAGNFTLEELCRSMWRLDKKRFLKIAADTNLSFFVTQFNREDRGRG